MSALVKKKSPLAVSSLFFFQEAEDIASARIKLYDILDP
jgi:hypothetical protein